MVIYIYLLSCTEAGAWDKSSRSNNSLFLKMNFPLFHVDTLKASNCIKLLALLSTTGKGGGGGVG